MAILCCVAKKQLPRHTGDKIFPQCAEEAVFWLHSRDIILTSSNECMAYLTPVPLL